MADAPAYAPARSRGGRRVAARHAGPPGVRAPGARHTRVARVQHADARRTRAGRRPPAGTAAHGGPDPNRIRQARTTRTDATL